MDINNKGPMGNGQEPTENDQAPVGNGQIPTGNGQAPTEYIQNPMENDQPDQNETTPMPQVNPIYVNPNYSPKGQSFMPQGNVPQNNTPQGSVPVHKKTSKLAITSVVFTVLLVLVCLGTGFKDLSVTASFAVLPLAFALGGLYATRPSGKVEGRIITYVTIGVSVVCLIASGVGGAIDARQEAKEAQQQEEEAQKRHEENNPCKSSIVWPSGGLPAMLPDPGAEKGTVHYDDSESMSIDVCDISSAEFNGYISQVQAIGFTVDYYRDEDSYDAYNAAGYSLYLRMNSEYGNVMSISLDAPSPDDASDSVSDATDDASADDVSTDTSAAEDPSTSDSSDAAAQSSGGVNADFKSTMDSYEQFMNQYVDFMKKYNESSNPLSMLSDYSTMMQQYSDYMTKIDAIDENSLSADDLAYYLEVQARVTQKLGEM